MSYRTAIEQLADSIRHVTARIPRQAAPAMKPTPSRRPSPEFTEEKSQRLGDAMRQVWAEKRNPALKTKHLKVVAEIERIIPSIDCGFPLLVLRNEKLRSRLIARARTQVIGSLAGRGYQVRDIATALHLTKTTVRQRISR